METVGSSGFPLAPNPRSDCPGDLCWCGGLGSGSSAPSRLGGECYVNLVVAEAKHDQLRGTVLKVRQPEANLRESDACPRRQIVLVLTHRRRPVAVAHIEATLRHVEVGVVGQGNLLTF